MQWHVKYAPSAVVPARGKTSTRFMSMNDNVGTPSHDVFHPQEKMVRVIDHRNPPFARNAPHKVLASRRCTGLQRNSFCAFQLPERAVSIICSVIGSTFAHLPVTICRLQIVLTEQVRALQFLEVVTKGLGMAVVQVCYSAVRMARP